MIRNFGKKPLSLLGFDHKIRNYVTVFSKLEKNFNQFLNSLNERCIPLKFKISYSPISMLPFIQKKKKNANMLNYWDIIIVTILCSVS